MKGLIKVASVLVVLGFMSSAFADANCDGLACTQDSKPAHLAPSEE
jgi:hypothetical protein